MEVPRTGRRHAINRRTFVGAIAAALLPKPPAPNPVDVIAMAYSGDSAFVLDAASFSAARAFAEECIEQGILGAYRSIL